MEKDRDEDDIALVSGLLWHQAWLDRKEDTDFGADASKFLKRVRVCVVNLDTLLYVLHASMIQ